ncbi:uncharacterized protein LOC141638690 [Silene latifolia]|uniref:uncharacterized protein LOC141638690 n=1 Tax=Silene latifolia TaxID=37657 RepID=UPI003D784BC2
MDVPFHGPPFTWMNNRHDNDLVLERLDRAYATQDWLNLYPAAFVLHLPILVSDHAPIILHLLPVTKPFRRPYRLDNWCLQFPEIADIVGRAWATNISGSSMFSLSRKLALVRFKVMEWVINHRTSHDINWADISNDLDSAGMDISDLSSAGVYCDKRNAYLGSIQKRYDYWVQRAKVKATVLDGIPTRFLFSRVKSRSSKQRILALKDSNGTWLHSPADISDEINTFFSSLYQSSCGLNNSQELLDSLDLPVLSPADHNILMAPFSENDILRALRNMDGSKSPGPDGITPKFFQIYWPQIGTQVSKALLRFLNSGVMLKEWNKTHIVLVPKVDKSETITQFRPISLCIVIYRLASKCLANRLKLVISSIVSETQQAFVPGRLMSDGCIIAQEILHYINKTKKGTNCYFAMKLDMHKAFDKVSWPFLAAILRRFGFPVFWQNIIWECISSVSYNILINGEPSSTLHPSCGLRQGDPLSPYLFIICMEILSKMLLQAEQQRIIQGLKISRYAPPISHLFYADDSFICCKATPDSFAALHDLFKRFELASGQMINFNKSYIKYSPNTPGDFKTHLTSILQVRPVDNLGLYLGVPIDLPRKKVPTFSFLVDKIASKVTSWSSLNLTQACKLVLINAVLIASINHVLAVVPIPVSICTKIESLILAFWWSRSANHRSIHWLSKDVLQAPKSEGGLDFKSISVLNQASLLKQFWRIQRFPRNLTARVLTSKYSKDFPLPQTRSRSSQPSFFWSRICQIARSCSDGIAWKLGNGKFVNLLSDKWVNGNSPKVRVSSRQDQVSLSSLLLPNGDWNPTPVYRIFEVASAREITCLEHPHPPTDDFIYWKFTEDGRYTIKSGYKFLFGESRRTRPLTSFPHFPWLTLWKMKYSTSFSIFFWKIAHNILPNLTKLSRRGFSIDIQCALCGSAPETLEHLFRSCTIAQHIWKSSLLGINVHSNICVPFVSWVGDLLSYLHNISDSSDQRLLYLLCVFKSIWLFRNKVIFQDSKIAPDQIMDILHSLMRTHSQFSFFLPLCYESFS